MHVETLIAMAVQQSLRKSMRGLAEQMGITVSSLSDWKVGKSPIPDDRIQQLAKIAGQDPGPWLLLIHSEQDGGELGRTWAALAAKLAGTVGILLCVVGLAGNPDVARASVGNQSGESSGMYIMYKRQAI